MGGRRRVLTAYGDIRSIWWALGAGEAKIVCNDGVNQMAFFSPYTDSANTSGPLWQTTVGHPLSFKT